MTGAPRPLLVLLSISLSLSGVAALLSLRRGGRRRSQQRRSLSSSPSTSPQPSPPPAPAPTPRVFALGGKYYQLLGHVWSHTTRDFEVLYRPLYDCGPKPGSFEGHALATSSLARWDAKFVACDPADLPPAAAARLLRLPEKGASRTFFSPRLSSTSQI